MNNLIWDIKNGTILKLSEGKQIAHALLGFQKLSKEQIVLMYGETTIE